MMRFFYFCNKFIYNKYILLGESMMLKKSIVKRITISSIALIILLITYFFPTKMENSKYPQNLSYSDIKKSAIYVLDKNMYVSRINAVINSENEIDKIKEIINLLTLKSAESEYLPTNFNGLIPTGTKINDISLDKGLLKIDFSKEFLNTTKELERKMIEALVYSLTELKSVDNILIFIDGSQLIELPFSKEKLPNILNKDFGINKVYDIDNIKNTTKTTIYYGGKNNEMFYYIPVTYVSNSTQEKIEIIIEKLKTSPIYESNLVSYLNASAEMTDYEILETEIKLSFNEYLLDNITNGTILEEVQYTIFLSLRDTYNIDKVEFNVENGPQSVNLVINF